MYFSPYPDLHLAFPPDNYRECDYETKTDLVDTIKKTSKSELLKNITMNMYGTRCDEGSKVDIRYVSVEFIEKFFSLVGVSKMIELAAELLDCRIGFFAGWPDLTLIKEKKSL